MAIKIVDSASNTNVYLFASEEAAINSLSPKSKDKFKAVAHSSNLGFYLQNLDTGEKFDDLGKINKLVL